MVDKYIEITINQNFTKDNKFNKVIGIKMQIY